MQVNLVFKVHLGTRSPSLNEELGIALHSTIPTTVFTCLHFFVSPLASPQSTDSFLIFLLQIPLDWPLLLVAPLVQHSCPEELLLAVSCQEGTTPVQSAVAHRRGGL